MQKLLADTEDKNDPVLLKLVTCALPYGNNHLHLGHLLEQIQADIFVRYRRMRGDKIVFICGEDTHGTPIMLQARKEGVVEEVVLKKYYRSHKEDSEAFGIFFDCYDSTHEPHAQEMVCQIYRRLVEKGFIYRKEIKQLYDTEANMFLPDRMVKGNCPCCSAFGQYGDSCEQCGATYSAEQLKDPRSVLTESTPQLRDSQHLFFDLRKLEHPLRQWLGSAHLQQSVVNKSFEWLHSGLDSWNISRDAPYFGVRIPGESNKFFYVWLDAVSGYLAASQKFWNNQPEIWSRFWNAQHPGELIQFIGKDIIYFHTLFWPAILTAVDKKLPTRINVHGYLTMKKEKMSKSRNTFLFAKKFRDHFPAESLRYYLACKLNDRAEDLDFSIDELCQKINSDLVGKIANLAARSSKFIHTYFEGSLSKQLTSEGLFLTLSQNLETIGSYFDALLYSKAIRDILQWADQANAFFNKHQPWVAIKDQGKKVNVHEVCSEVLNVFRLIAIALQPVVPNFSKKALNIFSGDHGWANAQKPILDKKIGDFVTLVERLTPPSADWA